MASFIDHTSIFLSLSVVCLASKLLSTKLKCLSRYFFNLSQFSSEKLKSLNTSLALSLRPSTPSDQPNHSRLAPHTWCSNSRRCRKFIIFLVDVVLSLFDYLDSALLARFLLCCFWSILLLLLRILAKFLVSFVSFFRFVAYKF